MRPVRVALATCSAVPEGNPDDHPVAELLGARFEVWDDASVDWASYDRVVVRSVWDYTTRVDEFLAWCHAVGPARLRNRPALIAFNTDKRYLESLSVPTVTDAVRRAGGAGARPQRRGGREAERVGGQRSHGPLRALGARRGARAHRADHGRGANGDGATVPGGHRRARRGCDGALRRRAVPHVCEAQLPGAGRGGTRRGGNPARRGRRNVRGRPGDGGRGQPGRSGAGAFGARGARRHGSARCRCMRGSTSYATRMGIPSCSSSRRWSHTCISRQARARRSGSPG